MVTDQDYWDEQSQTIDKLKSENAALKEQVAQLNLENLSLINQNIYERQEYGDAKSEFNKQLSALQSKALSLKQNSQPHPLPRKGAL